MSIKQFLAFFLIFLPIFDTVINPGLQGITVSEFSIFQVLRFSILSVYGVYILTSKRNALSGKVVVPASLLLSVLIISFIFNKTTFSDFSFIGQFAYWCILWILVDYECKDKIFRQRMRWGIVLASLVILWSFFYGFWTGSGINSYEIEGVKASTGWYTGKTINVTAALGSLLVAQNFSKSHRLWVFILFCVTGIGMWITQTRAGIVAYSCVLLWLIFSTTNKKVILKRFGLLAVGLISLMLIYMHDFNLDGVKELISTQPRWAELLEDNGDMAAKYFGKLILIHI